MPGTPTLAAETTTTRGEFCFYSFLFAVSALAARKRQKCDYSKKWHCDGFSNVKLFFIILIFNFSLNFWLILVNFTQKNIKNIKNIKN
jgi:hypothetical protein